MLQRLNDPNKEKEGYKQMYDSLIHERATKLGNVPLIELCGPLTRCS